MSGFLSLIVSFVVFMIIMGKGYLATLNPVSLVIVILISLAVGFAIVNIFGAILGSFLKVIFIVAGIGFVVALIGGKNK